MDCEEEVVGARAGEKCSCWRNFKRYQCLCVFLLFLVLTAAFLLPLLLLLLDIFVSLVGRSLFSFFVGRGEDFNVKQC